MSLQSVADRSSPRKQKIVAQQRSIGAAFFWRPHQNFTVSIVYVGDSELVVHFTIGK
jgi:hypothetical protein